MSTLRLDTVPQLTQPYSGDDGRGKGGIKRPLYPLEKLAWEFSSLDGISGRIARGHLFSSRGVLV